MDNVIWTWRDPKYVVPTLMRSVLDSDEHRAHPPVPSGGLRHTHAHKTADLPVGPSVELTSGSTTDRTACLVMMAMAIAMMGVGVAMATATAMVMVTVDDDCAVTVKVKVKVMVKVMVMAIVTVVVMIVLTVEIDQLEQDG